MSDRNKRAKNLRDTELNDMRHILQTEQGRRFLSRMLEYSGLRECNFTGNSTVYFNEGKRGFGVWLEKEIKEADINMYLSMIKEGHDITIKEKEVENDD